MFEAWNSFWLDGGDLKELAFARIVIVGYLLFFKLSDRAFDLKAWHRARVSLSNYWQMPWLLKVMKMKFLPDTLETILIPIYKISLFFSCIGFFTTISCTVALFAGLYLLGMRHGLKLHHTVMPIHFLLVAFILGPSGHELSVDSLIWSIDTEAVHLQLAQWSMQLMRVVFCLVIFATGVAKLRHIRLTEGFITSGNLSTLLRIHDFPYFYVHPLVSISGLLKRYRLLEIGTSLGTALIEFLFPLILFFPGLRMVFVPAMILLLFGFRFLMGARFDFFTVSLTALFFPWVHWIGL